jgi:hypothetical protein
MCLTQPCYTTVRLTIMHVLLFLDLSYPLPIFFGVRTKEPAKSRAYLTISAV